MCGMLSTPECAAVAAVAFAAAFAQGLTGFGSALVAMPLLAAFLEVRFAAPLTALLSLAVNAALLLPARRRLPWGRVLPLLAGALAGIPFGVLFLAGSGERAVRAALGTILGISSLLLGRGAPPGGSGPRWRALGAGTASGLLAGAFNTGGPPVLLYAATSGWTREETHAALQLYFLSSGLVVAALHAAVGLTTAPVIAAALAGLPGLALGAAAGWAVHRRVGEERYRGLFRAGLLLAGAALLYSALVR